MRIDPVRPEYDATVGAMARLHAGSATQASDPAKVAELVLRVAAMDEPPLRLLVGEDAFTYGTADGRALLAADERWAALSRSTTADDATTADLDPLGASH
jgi:poly(3-hydroxybutyrate) depolymerase